MEPKVNYPAAQIQRAVSSTQLSTGASVVVSIPRTLDGFKPAFLRVCLSGTAAYMNTGQNTAVTAVTSGTIVTANEALWINSLGIGALAFLQIAPGGSAFASVAACEEGAIRPPVDTSGLG